MGAAESTSRTNGTNQEEEERKKKSNTLVGAAATIATVGVAAWGISRMLSDNTETRENESDMKMKMKMKGEPSYALERSSQGIITWRPPPRGRLKLNIDGTCHPDEVFNNTFGDSDGDSVDRGSGGYGGILRNHNGKWVQGFIGYIGVTDSLTTEFHGILKGLEFLDKLCLNGAILETNCQAAFQWVTRRDELCGKKKTIHDAWNIILMCRKLAGKNNITINLFNREHAKKRANKCADKLADIAIKKRVQYEELMVLPNEMYDLVSEDAKLANF